jgi:hypothetical protein
MARKNAEVPGPSPTATPKFLYSIPEAAALTHEHHCVRSAHLMPRGGP